MVSLLYFVMLVGGRNGLGSGVLRIALLNTHGPGGSGPFGPHHCRISRHGGRCNRALPRPHADGDDSLQCRIVRRVDVGCHWGGRAWSFSLEGATTDGLIPPFRSGQARCAFPWLPLDVERPSFLPVEPLPPGAESAPRLRCAVLGNSRAGACCATASLLPQRSGPLEGSG